RGRKDQGRLGAGIGRDHHEHELDDQQLDDHQHQFQLLVDEQLVHDVDDDIDHRRVVDFHATILEHDDVDELLDRTDHDDVVENDLHDRVVDDERLDLDHDELDQHHFHHHVGHQHHNHHHPDHHNPPHP